MGDVRGQITELRDSTCHHLNIYSRDTQLTGKHSDIVKRSPTDDEKPILGKENAS